MTGHKVEQGPANQGDVEQGYSKASQGRKALEHFEHELYESAAREATSIKQVADLLQVTRQTAARRMGYFNLTIGGTEERPH